VHYKLKRFKLRSRRSMRRFEKRYREHPHVVPVLAGVSVLCIALILLITLRDSNVVVRKLEEANIVILHADDQTLIVPTREETVGGFLKNAQITLNEGDIVEPGVDTLIEEDDFRINVYRATPVVILDEDKRILSYSAAQTPRSIADHAGLIVYPEDDIRTAPATDFFVDGIAQKVVIKRSTPVNLNLYGTGLPLRTQAKTVGEVLTEKQVVLAVDDQVQPSLDTALSDNIQIFVTRFGTQVLTLEETIAIPTQTIDDTTLSFGTVVVRQQGAVGKKSVTYQLELKNGVEVKRTKIQEVIVQQPVTQIIAKGKAISIPTDKTAAMNAAGIAPSDHVYVNYIVSRESRWNVFATNSSSGAYGLCQALPGSKMASAGSDWQTNAVTQLKWCNSYAIGRYGTWGAAYDFWVARHWW
jgi:uncharacterized protein YabE (DUF348 family)